MGFGIPGAMIGTDIVNQGLGMYQGLRGEQLSRDTNALNYQMWQQQLEYDKPVNQVARLKEAGLNPALMYGTGSGANLAPNPIRAEAPTPRPMPHLDPGMVVSVQQARLLGEQARALKLENDQTEISGGRKGDNAFTRGIRELWNEFKSSDVGKHSGDILKAMMSQPMSKTLGDAKDFYFPHGVFFGDDNGYRKPWDRKQ